MVAKAPNAIVVPDEILSELGNVVAFPSASSGLDPLIKDISALYGHSELPQEIPQNLVA